MAVWLGSGRWPGGHSVIIELFNPNMNLVAAILAQLTDRVESYLKYIQLPEYHIFAL